MSFQICKSFENRRGIRNSHREPSAHELTDTSITVDAGCSFSQLERLLALHGRELCVSPSTSHSTIGGFLAGGNQGIGSIEHGSIWDDWVEALTVVDCVELPRERIVTGPVLSEFLHAFGTTGVITKVTMRTAPRRDRTALVAWFESLSAAAAAGERALHLAHPPRVMSIDDRLVYDALPGHPVVSGSAVMRTIIDTVDAEALTAIISDAGGSVVAVDVRLVQLISKSVFNHANLQLKRSRPDVIALQIRGHAILQKEADVRDCLPNTAIHLAANAGTRRGEGFSGLLFSEWIDDDTLNTGLRRLNELGINVVNPHTWLVGSHGGLETYWRAAARNDPRGLLNPGKLPPRAATTGVER